MATSVLNSSGHLQAQLTRSLERILEDASLSGELKLSGRKLKEFPKTGGKYNLNDTVVADLSKNRFSELPRDVTEFSSLEKLDLYHNAIRSLPQTVTQLQSLTYLDLSRNQLTNLPGNICSLPLKVLRIANNKINALPLDLPRLGTTLTELDADCNEIASLPPHVGQLPSLRSLRLRRNLLTFLPVEITSLRLVRLDISENRISLLPVELRKMTTLVTLEVGDNPLITPPACLCTRGRVHIFKYLEIQAMKDDKRKGVVSLTQSEESKIRRHRKPGVLSDFRLANGLSSPYNVPEDGGRQKRYTVDSGYSTSDGIDSKCWSHESRISAPTAEDEDGLTMGIIGNNRTEQPSKPGTLPITNGAGMSGTCFSGTSTPSTISPGESYMDLEEELAKVRQMEAKENADELVENGRRRKGSGGVSFQEQSGKRVVGHVRFNSNGSNGVNGGSPDRLKTGNADTSDPLRGAQDEGKKPLEHIQTYREYKEALRQQRGQEGLSIYRTRGSCGSSADGAQTPGSPVTPGFSNDPFRVPDTLLPDDALTSSQLIESSSPYKRAGPTEVEGGQRFGRGDTDQFQTKTRNGGITSAISTNGNGTPQVTPMVNGGHTHSPQHLSKTSRAPNGAVSPPPYSPPPSILSPSHQSSLQGETGNKRPSALTASGSGPRLVTTTVGYLGASQQTRTSLQWPPPPQPPSPSSPASATQPGPPGDPGGPNSGDSLGVRCRGGRVATVKQQLFWNRDVSPHKLTFTMRREFEKAKEEAELIERMRTSIETRLKMTLPEDLSPALSDGVVLCHLANHVKPRSVSSIYVPSPAVPKLTMARCRRNVDNFLEACRRIGVEEKYICSCEDVIGLGGDLSPNDGVLKGNLMAVLGTIEQLLSISSVSHLAIHQNGSTSHCGEGKRLSSNDNDDVDDPKMSLHGKNRVWDCFVSVLCISVFFSTIILLYCFPPPD